nr:alpha-L-rhamnosidase N-terminal domain-containing protein [Tessaracoccus coleopterorum]
MYLLRATALGVLDITLNGLPVSAECLAPGWTDVARTLQYQTLDVTDLLRPGANRLEIRVTDGWAVGHICWFGTAHYSPIRAVLAQVEALRDGGRDVIAGTGPHWSARESSLTYADLQNGCDTRVAADPGAPLDVIEVAPMVGECVAGVARRWCRSAASRPGPAPGWATNTSSTSVRTWSAGSSSTCGNTTVRPSPCATRRS